MEKGGIKTISILGATGSVGQSAIKYIKNFPERYHVHALTAYKNVDLLIECARDVKAKFVAIADIKEEQKLKKAFAGTDVITASGHGAILQAAQERVDWVIAAIVGTAGLEPTFAAVKSGQNIALANKEVLVCAGHVFMKEAIASGAKIFPIDSEHSGIIQILNRSCTERDILKYILTGSGGPFRSLTLREMEKVEPRHALKHPVWKMGAKISIDSATLMNKGLELIEASHLFSVSPDQLSVLIHPEGIVHALVEMQDGSTLAHLSQPDMCIPIAYALSTPYRMKTGLSGVDLCHIKSLHFEKLDDTRFKCYRLAMQVLEQEIQLAPVLNASNEEAVAAFLKQKISFLDIANIVELSLDQAIGDPDCSRSIENIEEAIEIDQISRKNTQEIINRRG